MNIVNISDPNALCCCATICHSNLNWQVVRLLVAAGEFCGKCYGYSVHIVEKIKQNGINQSVSRNHPQSSATVAPIY